jgi:glycosyltransferase involved in cell wall biosynthesis
LAAEPSPSLSVIVPVYNGQMVIARCLAALTGPSFRFEVIVVDDASTDGSGAVAARMGVRVLTLPTNRGPAAARNYGARHASGDILFFVDADVVVAPGALERVATAMTMRPEVAAIFGSYDAHPAADGLVSRYKNLLHHFVHQQGAEEGSTFWAGCGAVRRAVFEAMHGFDQERFPYPSIEDIELGYRLRQAGYRILLDPALQGTHLKRWTLGDLLWTDVVRRAAPWSRLILEGRGLVDDLNLRRDQRLSAALVGLGTLCLALALLRPWLLTVSAGALLGVALLNRRLYRFLAKHGGPGFVVMSVLLHWLYYLYSGVTYLVMWASLRLRALRRDRRTAHRAG